MCKKCLKRCGLPDNLGPFGPRVFRCFFQLFNRFAFLGSARAVVGSMLKIGQFYDHLNFGKYEPGH